MRTLTIFLISLFSLPLVLNAQSVDEMLQKVSAAIEAANGYCFARLIQAYMTEEDLSNYPEFETFRQIQEEININRL